MTATKIPLYIIWQEAIIQKEKHKTNDNSIKETESMKANHFSTHKGTTARED